MYKEINKDKSVLLAHILMVILVITWGFDYVPAKWALTMLTPSQVAFFKYAIGFIFAMVIKVVTMNRNLIRAKDIPIFIICALLGQVLYFECEYTAMNYMPVSLLTIVLSFVPVLSIVIERVLYKRKANKKIYLGILLCLFGVVLVIGADFSIIFEGRGIGYLLAVGAVISWNIYNFITAGLERYDSLTLSVTQMICTCLILIPISVPGMPPISEFSGQIIFGLLWIGLIDCGAGYLILVYGLKKLGPTTSALYSDFLPVTTTIFGALFLHESITWIQGLGGIVVIAAGYIVIKEKGKLDEERAGL